VSSNLHTYSTKPFDFKIGEAEVTLMLPAPEQEASGFCARTTVRSTTVLEAATIAHDLLRKVLNFVAYEMKARMRIERPVRSQVEGTGSIRQCAVYWSERPGIPVLLENHATEVQRLLDTDLPQQTERALSWLRWAYAARTVPEAFVFLQMVLERLAGEEDRESTCRQCGSPVSCPKHGRSTYRTVSRKIIEEMLNRHGVALSKEESRLRNRLIHGGMDYDAQDRITMFTVYRRLRSAVAEELRCQLQRPESSLSPSPDVYSNEASTHCQYKTAYPAEPFPQDCVRAEDIQEYRTLLQHGRQHPKVITLLQWPPEW
jgi:hypothetical protein